MKLKLAIIAALASLTLVGCASKGPSMEDRVYNLERDAKFLAHNGTGSPIVINNQGPATQIVNPPSQVVPVYRGGAYLSARPGYPPPEIEYRPAPMTDTRGRVYYPAHVPPLVVQ